MLVKFKDQEGILQKCQGMNQIGKLKNEDTWKEQNYLSLNERYSDYR
jgi:hypothetical protein